MSDVSMAFDAMIAKAPHHTRNWRYYDGDHPISFCNPKMRDVIPNGVVFCKNYCQVVVNATRDRLNIQTWDVTGDNGEMADDDMTEDIIRDIWKYTLKQTAQPLHVSTLATGEGFILAWPNADGIAKAYYHDPRQVVAFYDSEDPETMTMAAKAWCDGKKHYMNLYYPDKIEHYAATGEPHTGTSFQKIGDDVNQYNQIPVFHFRLDARRCTGELTQGVLSLQDAMNKLLNDMMVSSEYSSFPQRWGIGNFESGNITVGPATMVTVPPGVQGEQGAQMGAFPTTEPGNYLTPIDNLAYSMAVLSATPKHFFTGAAGDPSGEALQAMEAPLIAKVQGYQEVLSTPWAQAMAFCARINGLLIAPRNIEVIWKDPHTVQPQSQAQTRLTNTQAGIPIANQLRDEGWTDEQLEQLNEDKAAETMATTVQPSPVLMQRARITAPKTAEEAEPEFEGVVESPDYAGKLAATGALTRAMER